MKHTNYSTKQRKIRTQKHKILTVQKTEPIHEKNLPKKKGKKEKA